MIPFEPRSVLDIDQGMRSVILGYFRHPLDFFDKNTRYMSRWQSARFAPGPVTGDAIMDELKIV